MPRMRRCPVFIKRIAAAVFVAAFATVGVAPAANAAPRDHAVQAKVVKAKPAVIDWDVARPGVIDWDAHQPVVARIIDWD